jgi:transcriptional regulator with GAF, ATPase, and Fis domain
LEIRTALRASAGVKSRAARTLGITERMLSYKMKTYGIAPPAGPGNGKP